MASNNVHPLQRLFTYARQYQPDVIRATVYSVLNKFFDILPEVLIGVAVDVVVNKQDSLWRLQTGERKARYHDFLN